MQGEFRFVSKLILDSGEMLRICQALIMIVNVSEDTDFLARVFILFVAKGKAILPLNLAFPNSRMSLYLLDAEKWVGWVFLEEKECFGNLLSNGFG